MGVVRHIVGTVAVLAGVTASAPAAPFSFDPVNSNFTIGSSNLGPSGGGAFSGGSLGGFTPGLNIGAGFNGNSGNGMIIFDASGFRFNVVDLTTNWFFDTGAKSEFHGSLRVTPTVPNLSYKFHGFMNAIQAGNPTTKDCAGSAILYPNSASPFFLFARIFFFSGPGPLWAPIPQLGTQTGDLVMGQEYIMTWNFSLTMYHGGDHNALLAVDVTGGPYFRFELFQRPCDGDMNGDGYVDDADFASFAAAYDIFDCADPMMPPGCPSDINNDGFVDDSDFVLFATAYDALLCP